MKSKFNMYIFLIISILITSCSSRNVPYIYDIPESFNIPAWLTDGMFIEEIQKQIPGIDIIKSDTPIRGRDDGYYYIQDNIRYVFRINPELGLYEYFLDIIDLNYDLESAVLDFSEKYGQPQIEDNTFYWYIYDIMLNEEIEQNEYLEILFDNFVIDVMIVGKDDVVNRIYYYFISSRFIEE